MTEVPLSGACALGRTFFGAACADLGGPWVLALSCSQYVGIRSTRAEFFDIPVPLSMLSLWAAMEKGIHPYFFNEPET